jgi:tetratricopeptide (TPR) repeat protein
MLFHQTQGHPLFTIELLRGLQERGDLTRDSEGYWIEGPSLDWVTLPVRVEAAIQERIGRLPELLQAALAVASIEGEVFTAEVLARVRAVDKQKMLEYLSSELDRRHHLVQAQSIQRVDGNPLSRYRFRHILFQKYLYGSLDEVERVHLHERVGTALEELYGDQVESAASAVQMARHFEEAKITEKVTHYLHNAGIRALQLSAYQDGVAHLTRGLVLLGNQPVSSERARRELDLLLALGLAWGAAQGGQSVEAKEAFTRARELCQEVGNTSQMVQVLGGLVVWHYVQGELHQARELAEEALGLAQNAGEPLLILLCHWFLGFVEFCLGEHLVALEHLRYALDTYEPREHHHSLVSLRGSDAGLGAMAYEACCLWCLGYPEQANKRSEEALALAQELGHPFSSADVLFHAGCLFHSMRRDADSLETTAEELMRLSQERGLAGWYGNGLRSHGEALAMQGRVDEGVAQAREGIRAMMSESIWVYSSATLGSLAEAQARAGRLEDGLATVDEAFALVNKTDERFWEPELYRVHGVLLLGQGEGVRAERSFQEAIDIARKQSAKSLELRAVMGLCSLWMRQGRKTEAYELLSGIYNWFTEGFDTPDLVEARELLQGLNGELSPIQKRATK